MRQKIGTIGALYRFPVKSMAAEPLTGSPVGFRGLEGDRRFAFLIEGSKSSFPWLNASKLPALIGYKPYVKDSVLRVVTPGGEDLELQGDALRKELSSAFGSEVRLVHFKNGVFDEAEISVISTATIREIGTQSGDELDARRFRPNIVVDLPDGRPFQEDDWVGKILGNDDFSFAVTMRDMRCVMITIDPVSQGSNPKILKAVGQINQTCAGVYCTVTKAGNISVGDDLYLL